MRRTERIRKKKRSKSVVPIKKSTEKAEATIKTSRVKRGGFYDREYKKLLIIPFFVLLVALVAIGMHMANNDGDFINKGVSLKGGVFITVPTSMGVEELTAELENAYPNADIEGRVIAEGGEQIAITVSADIQGETQVDQFVNTIIELTGAQKEELSIETIGSSLGATFFQQTLRALFIAFLFMGFVVFLYFGEQTKVKVLAGAITAVAGAFMFSGSIVLNTIALILGALLIVGYARYSIPSVAVILAAASDLIITLAIVNLLGIKISTAGIAAFLMLIGYSVDTDILLSTRVLKRTGGTVFDRVISAVKTGLTMNFTTLAAVTIALIVSKSAVISQIMTILLIGLIVDMMNTWLQNVGILRWFLEKKGDKS